MDEGGEPGKNLKRPLSTGGDVEGSGDGGSFTESLFKKARTFIHSFGFGSHAAAKEEDKPDAKISPEINQPQQEPIKFKVPLVPLKKTFSLQDHIHGASTAKMDQLRDRAKVKHHKTELQKLSKSFVKQNYTTLLREGYTSTRRDLMELIEFETEYRKYLGNSKNDYVSLVDSGRLKVSKDGQLYVAGSETGSERSESRMSIDSLSVRNGGGNTLSTLERERFSSSARTMDFARPQSTLSYTSNASLFSDAYLSDTGSDSQSTYETRVDVSFADITRKVQVPPPPVTFVREQQWVKELRDKMMGLTTSWRNEDEEDERIQKALQEEKEKVLKETESAVSLAQPKKSWNNFPELTTEHLQKIKIAMATRTGEIIKKFRIPIEYKSLSRLSDRGWLDDELINFYMELLMERQVKNAEIADKDPNVYRLPKIHAFNTFFYPKLLKGYNTVCRWTKKFDIFEKDIVLVPIHLGNHWTLAVIDFREKTVKYYDSLHNSNPKCVSTLRQYLQEEHMDKKNSPFDYTGWTTAQPKNIPAQENGYDCGVFTCIFAEYSSRGEPFDFSQSHMKYFRQRLIYEISQAELLIR